MAPFVVAFGEDSLRFLSDRAAALGGVAHVIIFDEMADGHVRLRVLRTGPYGSAVAGFDGVTNMPVSEDATLGTALAHLHVGSALRYQAEADGAVICYLSDSIQPVPA